MTSEELNRIANLLINFGDRRLLEEHLKDHPSCKANQYRVMAEQNSSTLYQSEFGFLAPVVNKGAGLLGLSRAPVFLMPVSSHAASRRWSESPLHFEGSRDVFAHALFAARKESCDDLGLFADQRPLDHLRSLPSAGLSAFLAAFFRLQGKELNRWVGCTGVLRSTAHPGILPPVGKVDDIVDKYLAMVESEHPKLGLILLPKENEEELKEKLGGLTLDDRVIFVATLQEAVHATWEGEEKDKPQLGELPAREQVRHLEAEWFRQAYMSQRQNAVISDAERLLERHGSGKAPLSAVDQVICHTIRGAYYGHRGEGKKATEALKMAEEVVRKAREIRTSTVDLARIVRVCNVQAVAATGRLDPDEALALVGSFDEGTIRLAGEEGLFLLGTKGQALSLRGGLRLARGQNELAEEDLRASTEIHSELAAATSDAPRHKNYAARALALLGRFEEALETLPLDGASRWKEVLNTDHATQDSVESLLVGVAQSNSGFELLRIAHLCWATGNHQRWIALCRHLKDSATGEIPKEFKWPLFGTQLHHAIILAELGHYKVAVRELDALPPLLVGRVDRDLPLLYWFCARLRVVSLAPWLRMDEIAKLMSTYGKMLPPPLKTLVAPLTEPAELSQAELQQITKALWTAVLY